jgi:hypothetical protein
MIDRGLSFRVRQETVRDQSGTAHRMLSSVFAERCMVVPSAV